MSDVKALRALVGVRQREATRLDERLAMERRALTEREAEADIALSERDAARGDEQAKRDEREQLMSSAFTPAALKVLEFAIADRVAEVARAEKAPPVPI
jgi:hypothetical protein